MLQKPAAICYPSTCNALSPGRQALCHSIPSSLYPAGSCVAVETLYVILSANGNHSLEFAQGESDGTLWPQGVPADGSTHREIENFPHLWLWVVSYVVNSVVIMAALVCLVFTVTFHNRK